MQKQLKMKKLLEFARGEIINPSVLFVVSRGEDGSLVSSSCTFIEYPHNILILPEGIKLTTSESETLIKQAMKKMKNM